MIRAFRRALRAWVGEMCDRLADWLTPGPPEPALRPAEGERVRSDVAAFVREMADRSMIDPRKEEDTMPKPKQSKRKGPQHAALPPRTWLHVVPRGTGTGREWAVLKNGHAKGQRGELVSVEETKRAALTLARSEGRRLWAAGQPVQVVIHGADGAIKSDATFGADPRRSRG